MHFQSAVAQLTALGKGSVTSRDLVEMYVERIERFDSTTNSVVARRFEAARTEADQSDRNRSKQTVWGPLEGLPITIKESFGIAGLPTTWGLPHLKDNIAKSDALAVQRLKSAGAIVLGKTNVPELLADWQTFNPVYGVTSNPWDPTRSPGGSSGGSAVAIAAGYSALELGSDIGSSIRAPAHFCGIYGHKSTYGIASPLGQAPHPFQSVPDLSVIGPMARSAGDLALALSVISGPNSIDGRAWRLELPGPRFDQLSAARIGVVLEDSACPLGAEVRGAIERLSAHLRRAGASVSIVRFPGLEPADLRKLYLTMLRATTSRNHNERELERFRSELAVVPDSDDSYWCVARRASLLSHREWLGLNERRHRLRLRADCEEFFSNLDMVIATIASTPAWLHDPSNPRHERIIEIDGVDYASIEQLYWAAFATLAYLPATAVPIGRSADGLPIGVQIIGRSYDDRTTIWLADMLEQTFYSFTAPPGY